MLNEWVSLAKDFFNYISTKLNDIIAEPDSSELPFLFEALKELTTILGPYLSQPELLGMA